MFLAGIQKMFGLDLRWETDEVTVGTNVYYGTTGTFGTFGTDSINVAQDSLS